MTLILIGVGSSGCSLSRTDAASAKLDDKDLTGSLGAAQAKASMPTDSDLAFARNAASDVLSKETRIPASTGKTPRPAHGGR